MQAKTADPADDPRLRRASLKEIVLPHIYARLFTAIFRSALTGSSPVGDKLEEAWQWWDNLHEAVDEVGQLDRDSFAAILKGLTALE